MDALSTIALTRQQKAPSIGAFCLLGQVSLLFLKRFFALLANRRQ